MLHFYKTISILPPAVSTHHRFRRGLLVAALALSALVCGSLSACEEPTLLCNVAVGDFAVHTFRQSGDKDCLPEIAVMGLEAFFGDAQGQPDFRSVTVAIQSAEVAARQDAYPEVRTKKEPQFASGKFENPMPDENGQCTVAKLATARPKFPAIDIPDDPDTEADEAVDLPEIDSEYSWSDVVITYTPEISGTQFIGKLAYRDRIAGCEATYVVRGLWPKTPCMDTSECEETCETVDGIEGLKKTKLCSKTAVQPEWLEEGSVICLGASKGENESEDVPGLCVFKDKSE